MAENGEKIITEKYTLKSASEKYYNLIKEIKNCEKFKKVLKWIYFS